MSSSVDEFIDRTLFDVQHRLRIELDGLRNDLLSEDSRTRNDAKREVSAILSWLLPPAGPISLEQKLRRSQDALADENMSIQDRLDLLKRIARSTGRPRGRPRTDTAQQAICAFSLRLATALSWREIALRVKGCNHKRPYPEQRSCKCCGDAIRDAVGRLDNFLRSRGHEFVRRVELEAQIDLQSRS
jgi:hypothetical protein